jgi:hypothetical protein
MTQVHSKVVFAEHADSEMGRLQAAGAEIISARPLDATRVFILYQVNPNELARNLASR